MEYVAEFNYSRSNVIKCDKRKTGIKRKTTLAKYVLLSRRIKCSYTNNISWETIMRLLKSIICFECCHQNGRRVMEGMVEEKRYWGRTIHKYVQQIILSRKMLRKEGGKCWLSDVYGYEVEFEEYSRLRRAAANQSTDWLH